MSENLYVWTFEKEARNQHKTIAVSFIDEYKKEFSKLQSDPVANGLLKKRNIKVHRKKADSLMHVEAHSEEILQISETSSAVLYDFNGNVIQRSDSRTDQENNNLHKSNESQKTATIKWYFNEYPIEEGVLICEKFLNSMKNFKNFIVTKYP